MIQPFRPPLFLPPTLGGETKRGAYQRLQMGNSKPNPVLYLLPFICCWRIRCGTPILGSTVFHGRHLSEMARNCHFPRKPASGQYRASWIQSLSAVASLCEALSLPETVRYSNVSNPGFKRMKKTCKANAYVRLAGNAETE